MSVLVIALVALAGLTVLAALVVLLLCTAAGHADRRLEQIMDEENEHMNKPRMQDLPVGRQDEAHHVRESRNRSTQPVSDRPIGCVRERSTLGNSKSMPAE